MKVLGVLAIRKLVCRVVNPDMEATLGTRRNEV